MNEFILFFQLNFKPTYCRLAMDEKETRDDGMNMDDTQDNQSEDSNGDEEYDDEEDDTYTLRFEGEINPLALTEVDADGVHPYQHLERMEYEALADKKRKAIIEYHQG